MSDADRRRLDLTYLPTPLTVDHIIRGIHIHAADRDEQPDTLVLTRDQWERFKRSDEVLLALKYGSGADAVRTDGHDYVLGMRVEIAKGRGSA